MGWIDSENGWIEGIDCTTSCGKFDTLKLNIMSPQLIYFLCYHSISHPTSCKNQNNDQSQNSSSALQLGLITNTLLIHPSAQGLTLVGHAQQVLCRDQRSRPFHCPPGDPLASALFVTAILLIQLEPENVARLPDKRLGAMPTVHRRVSKKQRVRITDRPSLHKCSITMEKPNGMTERQMG